MITLRSHLHVDDLNGAEVVDVLLACTDQLYQAWWPGTHLHLHTLVRYPNTMGNLISMDEFVGRWRIQLQGVVRVAEPGKRLVWQFKRGLPLPVWLVLDLADDASGVTITHTDSGRT